MVRAKIQVENEFGLHLRPAGELADAAMKFASDVNLIYNGKSVNGKSLLSVLSLGVKGGYIIEVVCSGTDEEEALAAVLDIIEAESAKTR